MDDGSCSVTCGGGEVTQLRTVQVQVAHGGVECPAEMSQVVSCGEDPCPINCVFESWSARPERSAGSAGRA